jgi:hypothetical protein
MLGRSVNRRGPSRGKVVARLDNVCFNFSVIVPDDLHLTWQQRNNGVMQFIEKKEEYTLILTRSPNKDNSSLLVLLSPGYFRNRDKGLIEMYNTARRIARRFSERLRLEIAVDGQLAKKPHTAFDPDLSTCFIGDGYGTVETATVAGGKAWIDSSYGYGELETDDADYAYLKLIEPEIVADILQSVSQSQERSLGFRNSYHPVYTINS